MATYTEHYNLIKPALNDKVNINNLNDNADIIDTALNNKVNTSDTQDITTSANKCMLSDGVTSVEDALDTLSDQSGSYKRGIISPNSSVEIQMPIGGRSYLLYTYADNSAYNAFSILAFFYTGIYKNISIVASTNITITDSIANRVVRLTNNTNYGCNYAIKNI